MREASVLRVQHPSVFVDGGVVLIVVVEWS